MILPPAGQDHRPGHRAGLRRGLPAVPPGQRHRGQPDEARGLQRLPGSPGTLQRRPGPLLRLPEHQRRELGFALVGSYGWMLDLLAANVLVLVFKENTYTSTYTRVIPI